MHRRCAHRFSLCVSPLSVRLLLVGAELQQAELSQGGLQLLFALLHLLLELRVDAAELHVVPLGVCLFSAELLDSGLQLGQTKWGEGTKGYSFILTAQRSRIPAPTSFCLLRVFSKSCSRTFSTSSSCPLCFCFILSLILQYIVQNGAKMILFGPGQNQMKGTSIRTCVDCFSLSSRIWLSMSS